MSALYSVYFSSLVFLWSVARAFRYPRKTVTHLLRLSQGDGLLLTEASPKKPGRSVPAGAARLVE